MKSKKIKELESQILKHKRLYYSGQKEIEDEEYDKLEAELKALDPDNKALHVVGSDFFKGEKVKHEKPMLSLDKKYEASGVTKWRDKEPVVATYKIDGSSASIVYKNNRLHIAKTRGDGLFGENISQTAYYIPNILNKISEKAAEVRGEIFCTEEDFHKLIHEMESRGLEKPKSKRNIVAGILGRKDHKDLAQFLTFYAFELLDSQVSELETFDKLKELGFSTPPYKYIDSDKELRDFIHHTQKFMEEGEYMIDGAVFTFNSKELQEDKGYTGHHPKYKMSFKFQGDVAETDIKEIIWQISRFGVYTPVAIIEPVDLSGATITNVTLHNYKTVQDFDLKPGVKIKIIRSGEVIPKFLTVVKECEGELPIPESCNYCETKLEDDGVRIACRSQECPGRHQEYILNFIKKIGIDDLSEKRLVPIMEKGFVKDIPDVYKLTKEDLLTLPRTGEKLTEKIIKNINKSKKVSIIKFFDSLSFVGGSKKNTERCIEEGYDSIEKLLGLKEEDVLKIDGFAEIKARKYISSLQKNRELIQELLDLGVEVEFPEKMGDGLSGLTLCVTGKTSIPRKKIESFIKENGGKASSSLSSNTDFLICNEESGSSKYTKAQELKVPILKEDEFKKKFNLDY